MSLSIIRPDWPAPSTVHAFVTSRTGGVSKGPWKSMNLGLNSGDDPQAVLRNREMLSTVLPSSPQWLRQVHGTRVVEHAGRLMADLEADAIVSRNPGRICAVLTADCLPVLFCDVKRLHVAVAHAGWRGLAGGILQNVVERMDADPHDLIAWLGPAIGPSAYEVGREVRSAFDDELSDCFVPRGDKWLFNLYAAARILMGRSGLSSIHGGEFCTFEQSDRFYSFRRDGTTGRMATVIWSEQLIGQC